MRSTCLQIVPVHALRMMPISRFVLPCAIQVRTSVSRAVSPNEPSGFFTSISLVFVLILGFLFLCGAFIWLLIFCQHEQSWGKLYDSWCIGVSGPCSAGGKLFGLRLVLVIENSFPGGALLDEAFIRSYGACKEKFYDGVLRIKLLISFHEHNITGSVKLTLHDIRLLCVNTEHVQRHILPGRFFRI